MIPPPLSTVEVYRIMYLRHDVTLMNKALQHSRYSRPLYTLPCENGLIRRLQDCPLRETSGVCGERNRPVHRRTPSSNVNDGEGAVQASHQYHDALDHYNLLRWVAERYHEALLAERTEVGFGRQGRGVRSGCEFELIPS